MRITKTDRGFQIVRFKDRGGVECTLQQSSAIDDTDRGMEQPGSSFVWLGGIDARMHLSRERVAELLPILSRWLETGKFE